MIRKRMNDALEVKREFALFTFHVLRTVEEERITLTYGLMAEFGSDEALLAAARRASEAGYRRVEAYSPFPIDGLREALGRKPRYWLNWVVLAGFFGAVAAGIGIQYFAVAIDYPINIGGRPLFRWPVFIPPAIELAILVAALAAVAGLFLLSGLPHWHHPVFSAPRFGLATKDRFFLLIETTDPQFDRVETDRFLKGLGAVEVVTVRA